MTNAARFGDLASIHGCYPERVNDQGSLNVFINGLGAHCQNHHWLQHCCNDCHDSFLLKGSPTVFVNNLQQGRVDDPVACGSFVLTGSPNTFVGNGGSFHPSPAQIAIIEAGVPSEVVFSENPRSDFEPTDAETFNDTTPDTGTTIFENNSTPPPPPASIPTDCSDVNSHVGNFPDDFPLSENFTLGDLTTGAVYPHKLQSQGGLTEQQIVCNLRALAVNVLEPIYTLTGGFTINSGFRTGGGKSQHLKGQAADIRFAGQGRVGHFKIAETLIGPINYDQLILENYISSNGIYVPASNSWIHVSYNPTGTERRQVLSQKSSGTSYASGLRTFENLLA